MSTAKPSYLNFNSKDYSWKNNIDYKKHPDQYRVGKGEQGVLICEPYKSEIGQYWRFKTAEIAQKSAGKIFNLFENYIDADDFVGADMARKYLQMGFTRARRYFNYKGGKKYDVEKDYKLLDRGTGDTEKALAAEIFYKIWQVAEKNSVYTKMKSDWKKRYG